jgi:glycosyltransferase involved in cell wall biosynthesis
LISNTKNLVVMVGTALEGRGGMSSVIASYRQHGLFEHASVHYVEAHREVPGISKAFLALSGLFSIVRLLIFGRVALLHIHAASGISFWRKALFSTLAHSFGRPVIFHIHGGEFLEFFHRSSVVGRWLIRWHLEGAVRVIVLSKIWEERLREISPSLHLISLPNPVALPENLSPNSSKSTALNFLFLGRLERAKGVFEAVAAFAQVVSEYPDARLILAGEGDQVAVEAQAVELGILEKVSFPGWVSGVAKTRLLASAQVFILPSHVEGLPVSMLEAMAFGLPVIVSRVGSVPEVLVDGENGLMVEVGNVESLRTRMLILAGSAAMRTRLGLAGQSLVASQFAAPKVCRQLEQVYAEVLGEARL